jgi:hypothetical protein
MHMTSARARLAALVLAGVLASACGGGGGGDGDGTDGSDTTGSTSVDATSVATMTTTGPQPTTTGVSVSATVTVGTSETGTVPEPCCTASNVPGCAEDPGIAECVCEVDRFCCESVWDEVCAEKVVALGCGVCDPGPSTMTTTAGTTLTSSDVTTGQPPDNVGACCSEHPETGCELAAISECVCDAEPSCCTDEWHAGCVDAVDANGCGVCPPDPTDTTVSTTDPDTGVPPDNTESCCAPHDSTGCEYPAIAECVCNEDPACCDIAWTEECIDAVGALGCGVCPP